MCSKTRQTRVERSKSRDVWISRRSTIYAENEEWRKERKMNRIWGGRQNHMYDDTKTEDAI